MRIFSLIPQPVGFRQGVGCVYDESPIGKPFIAIQRFENGALLEKHEPEWGYSVLLGGRAGPGKPVS